MMRFLVVIFLCSTSTLREIISSSIGLEQELSINFQEIVKPESFDDWKNWDERYPQCSKRKNPNTSPIKIEGENTVSVTNDMKGIFVYSKLPVDDCLSLSMLYKVDYIEIEAVTINALPACMEQLTYVSGGSDKSTELRYFNRAVFVFTKAEPEVHRFFHQVKGKTFQMEILLEFLEPNEKSVTQIFTLVEAKPSETTPANPVFTALEPALTELTQEIFNEASGRTERAIKYIELENACKNNEAEYHKAFQETQDIFETDRLHKIKAIIRNIKEVTNKDVERLFRRNELIQSSNETGNMSIGQQIEKLKEQRSNLFALMQEEDERWAFLKLQKIYEKVEYVIRKFELMEETTPTLLETLKEILKANKVGVPGESSFPEMLYEDPDAVHRDLLETQRKINKYYELKVKRREFCIFLHIALSSILDSSTRFVNCSLLFSSKGLYSTSCKEFIEFQKKPYAFVRIRNPFQISWLFPHTGGYYFYNGSNPIPECEQRDTTIVFEEPISITTEQLSLFKSLPSLVSMLRKTETSNGSESQMSTHEDKEKMVSALSQDEQERRVWHVSKDPIFLDDDGFHMKSSQVVHVVVHNDKTGTTKQKSFLYIYVPLSIRILYLLVNFFQVK